MNVSIDHQVICPVSTTKPNMGEVENSKWGVATNIPVAVAAPHVECKWRPEPTAPHFESQWGAETTAPHDESQWRPEPKAPHFESQCTPFPHFNAQQAAASTEENVDNRARIAMGITLFILILLGFLALIIEASIVVPLYTDGIYIIYIDDYVYFDDFYRDGSAYTAPAPLLVPRFVCFIAAIVIASVLTCGCCCAGNYKLKPRVKKWVIATLVILCLVLIVDTLGVFLRFSKSIFVAIFAIESVLLVVALIFSGLFNWGCGCGALHAEEG